MSKFAWIEKFTKHLTSEAAKPERAGQIAVVSMTTGIDFYHIGPEGKWNMAIQIPCQVVDIQGDAKVAWLDSGVFIRHLAYTLLEMIGEDE